VNAHVAIECTYFENKMKHIVTKIDCNVSIDLFSTLSPSNSRISSPGCKVPEAQNSKYKNTNDTGGHWLMDDSKFWLKSVLGQKT
jgi:hypothetical protein